MNIRIILLILITILIIILGFILYYNIKNIYNTKYCDIPSYDIIEIPDFLTSEECDKIIELSNGNLFTSKIYSDKEDLLLTDSRKSEQCWLKDDISLIKKVSDKVKMYTNEHGYQEELQVVKYPIGGYFKPHYDACEGDNLYCTRMNGENGQRLFTVLFYLNDDFDGGETVFPLINKIVKPKKGKAVIFKNVDKNGFIIKQALHGGEPIKTGEKWIANKWIHIK